MIVYYFSLTFASAILTVFGIFYINKHLENSGVLPVVIGVLLIVLGAIGMGTSISNGVNRCILNKNCKTSVIINKSDIEYYKKAKTFLFKNNLKNKDNKVVIYNRVTSPKDNVIKLIVKDGNKQNSFFVISKTFS